MPIEIKELNIRIHVNQPQPEQDGKTSAGGQSSAGGSDKDEVVAECVEQVMELIRNKQDR